MTLRIGSLCTGYGGLDMAVHAVLGGELAWVADNDPGAAAILAHRFPSLPNFGDIAAADWTAAEPVDVLAAGFPCQDVSCAGGRAGLREGNRTGVWAHVARAIDELRPSLVVLENVGGLLSAGADSDVEPCAWCLGDSGHESVLRALGAVLGDLAEVGFDAEWASLRAADAGAPHRRERVFIIAWPAADAGSHEPGGDVALGGDTARYSRHRSGSGDRGTAEDADSPAGGERRQPAPGQAEGGRARADAGRSGGVLAPDADSGGRGAGERLIREGESDAGRSTPADPFRCGRPRRSSDEGGSLEGTAARRDREAAAEPGRARFGQLAGGAPAQEARPFAGDEPSGDRGLRPAADWGPYRLAIARWGGALGRPAPRPTEPGRTGERLSPLFVEWMMGLPEGWVTGVPGLSRNAQLKALGNGVVPQQAASALRTLLDRASCPCWCHARFGLAVPADGDDRLCGTCRNRSPSACQNAHEKEAGEAA